MVYCIIRHRATFPRRSIIAATGLSFCVRNENRRFPSAMSTEQGGGKHIVHSIWANPTTMNQLLLTN